MLVVTGWWILVTLLLPLHAREGVGAASEVYASHGHIHKHPCRVGSRLVNTPQSDGFRLG